ncbi:MAG TPA: hypothetical protein VL551_31270 [Actinospica sp.]|jgi:hypothetical protein|nr:hypothetical protein [Actinospica sp.]
MKRHKAKIAGTTAVVVLMCTTVTAHAAEGRPAGRGTLLSVTKIGELTPAEVQAAVEPFFGDTRRVKYGISDYRITYATVDAWGRPTVASGLIALPEDRTGRVLRVVSYDHGTNPTRDTVASVAAGDGDREAVELFASAGYAAVAPDYVGLGTGAGLHPYMDLSSEVTATVDMLDAGRALAARHGVVLDPRLLVTGFSQGGPAAMATAEAVQDGEAGHGWRLAALAPISGPYDVQHAETPAMLNGELDPESSVLYISYWTVALNRVYHLYDRPDEAFRQPYAGIVEGLYDGNHSEEQILAALPGSVDQLLTPRYLAWLEHPSGALLAAMRQSDGSCAWHPDVPVELYAANGDKDVAIADSEHCDAQLTARGADVQLTDLGDVDHNHSAMLAIPRILAFFDGRTGL